MATDLKNFMLAISIPIAFKTLKCLTLGNDVAIRKMGPCDPAYTVLEDDPPYHVEVTARELILVAIIHASSML
jgi:hypothetical protein